MIEALDHSLESLIKLFNLIFEFISVFCVFFGLISLFPLGIRKLFNHQAVFLRARIRLGSWLILALEFQLGADILATTVSPTFEDLGKLAILAFIRTFMNYFLQLELETEKSKQDKINQVENDSKK